MRYINTLKQELDGTRSYQETASDEMSVVNAHLNDFLFVSVEVKTNFLRCGKNLIDNSVHVFILRKHIVSRVGSYFTIGGHSVTRT